MNVFSRPRQAFALAILIGGSVSAFAQQPSVQDRSDVEKSDLEKSDDQASSPPPQASSESAQTPSASGTTEAEPPGGKRVFGVLPNYRTADASQEGTTLTTRQKFTIASKDSFDYPLVILAGAFAGLGQLSNQQPSFGQGLKGYGHRLLTNYADQAMGNMFTEGLFPVMLHEDPRYFRLGTGPKWHRTKYAFTRVFITHKDGGGTRFNYSEWLGNASSVAISNAYYPDNRNISDNVTKLFTQVGTDALSQVLKEFWPDIRRKFFHKGTD
jgi:hypothetical protein